MDVLSAIKNRKSTRAFIDKQVLPLTISNVLDTARWAPSGANTQPWKVAVATGGTKTNLCLALTGAFESSNPSNADYNYYANPIEEPYRDRQRRCGAALYGALDISRQDKQQRRAQWLKNYFAFDAPVILFIFIDRNLEKGSWVDMGMFIQNIMLAARGHGLESCPQAALAEYPDIVRSHLSITDKQSLICGIALGYCNTTAPVNQYRTEREPVDSFTSWHS
ncbi:MAG: nitroreductase [Planctomycetaceae bacterium]|jgi:nitroreductase|nr:nitroreductase [Planctomycetaceae bacterium]MBT4013098.1 nitroreductase [Planctomycetaceae bacterium]MBT4725576.1 nitroreductase [Planctomycetaceae bacterium]MBT4846328.1 nitroreductase [Planctomycetaceae bacterium]MBT5125212.1 nitroreductase [Planctomycetaceae bacterium]